MYPLQTTRDNNKDSKRSFADESVVEWFYKSISYFMFSKDFQLVKFLVLYVEPTSFASTAVGRIF